MLLYNITSWGSFHNWRVATEFENELCIHDQHAVNCTEVSVKDVDGKGDDDIAKEKSTGSTRGKLDIKLNPSFPIHLCLYEY
jgi:hypothetical protein